MDMPYQCRIFLAALVFVSVQLWTSSALDCTAAKVQINEDGELDFLSIPRNFEYDPFPEYEPGPFEGVYTMARKFVDSVRPGCIPYCEAILTFVISYFVCM